MRGAGDANFSFLLATLAFPVSGLVCRTCARIKKRLYAVYFRGDRPTSEYSYETGGTFVVGYFPCHSVLC